MSCLLENVSHVKSQAPTPSPPFNVEMKMTKKSQPLATLHEKWRLMVVTCWLPKLLLNICVLGSVSRGFVVDSFPLFTQ